jgi:hypothetical protein
MRLGFLFLLYFSSNAWAVIIAPHIECELTLGSITHIQELVWEQELLPGQIKYLRIRDNLVYALQNQENNKNLIDFINKLGTFKSVKQSHDLLKAALFQFWKLSPNLSKERLVWLSDHVFFPYKDSDSVLNESGKKWAESAQYHFLSALSQDDLMFLYKRWKKEKNLNQLTLSDFPPGMEKLFVFDINNKKNDSITVKKIPDDIPEPLKKEVIAKIGQRIFGINHFPKRFPPELPGLVIFPQLASEIPAIVAKLSTVSERNVFLKKFVTNLQIFAENYSRSSTSFVEDFLYKDENKKSFIFDPNEALHYMREVLPKPTTIVSDALDAINNRLALNPVSLKIWGEFVKNTPPNQKIDENIIKLFDYFNDSIGLASQMKRHNDAIQ